MLDEMKLSENVVVQASGKAEGFVNLGQFTSEEHKGVLADHGMVLLFQPFCGKWTQILGKRQKDIGRNPYILLIFLKS